MINKRCPQSVDTALAECEEIIGRGLDTFIEVGEALCRIRDDHLYRASGYTSFDTYCRDQWDLGRSRAYQLIDASEVVRALPEGTPVPANEAQARELKLVEPEDRAGVMEEAARGGKPTAPAIQAAATKRQRPASNQPAPTKAPGPKYTGGDIPDNVVAALGSLPVGDRRQDVWDRAVAACGGKIPGAGAVKNAAKAERDEQHAKESAERAKAGAKSEARMHALGEFRGSDWSGKPPDYGLLLDEYTYAFLPDARAEIQQQRAAQGEEFPNDDAACAMLEELLDDPAWKGIGARFWELYKGLPEPGDLVRIEFLEAFLQQALRRYIHPDLAIVVRHVDRRWGHAHDISIPD